MGSALPNYHRAYLDHTLGAHAAYTLHFHLVWSVRGRQPLLVEAVAQRLEHLLFETAQRAKIQLLALHIEPEHVHLLVSLTPTQAVADVVRRLKGATAHQLRVEFVQLHQGQDTGLWNSGYFARTLGAVNVAQAKAYLDRQRAHHHGVGLGGVTQGATPPASDPL